MAGSSADWEHYFEWNEALASVVFTRDSAGRPVYLDLDDVVLESIGEIAAPGAVDSEASLAAAVRATLKLSEADVLLGHLYRVRRWRSESPLAPPPSLALLAVLSLAAERMHEGEGKASTNYYARLAELLELSNPQSKRLETAYRREYLGKPASEFLWSSLNQWLENCEGERGVPTAFALLHPHMGLPLSQALVRRADRDRFDEMFAGFGFPPHAAVSTADMHRLIDGWMGQVPCPASAALERLWKRDAASQERIADVARVTLRSWGGTAATTTDPSASHEFRDAARATALLITFPRHHLEITFAVPDSSPVQNAAFDLLDSNDGTVGQLELTRLGPSWLGLSETGEIDVDSFLRGHLRLRARSDGKMVVSRRPRRLIPMRRDVLVQAFVETERVQLGEDSLLLARSDIAQAVGSYLDHVARPGFAVHTELDGLPRNWVLFSDVQVLSAAPANTESKLVDLDLLRPLTTFQSLLQGGFQLPGHIRKWLTGHPPELRIAADDKAPIHVEMQRREVDEGESEVRSMSVESAPAVWDLADESLVDGDYEISIFENQSKRPKQRMTLRLRSADSPAGHLDGMHELLHPLDNPLYPILASAAAADEVIRGGWCPEIQAVDNFGPEPSVPTWVHKRTDRSGESTRHDYLVIPTDLDRSCIETGAHYIVLPDAGPGTKPKIIDGVCKNCGLIKRYPTAPKKKSLKSTPSPASHPPNLNSIAPVRGESDQLWDAGFEALCHVGAGSSNALRRIALQIQPAEYFVDAMARSLEALGHIEIERESISLTPSAWCVAPPVIVGLPSGGYVFAGFRNGRLLAALRDFADEERLDLTIEPSGDDGPSVWHLAELGDELADRLVELATQAMGRQTVRVPDCALRLAGSLPPFSRVVANLPITAAVGARKYERWNASTAEFDAVADAGGEGAFRLTSYGRRYVFRRPSDVGSTTALVGDARIVKYAAALVSAQPLVGYDNSNSVLYVPLGADLPGLYGRSAVLASGLPPRVNTSDRVLEYRQVPKRLATQLSTLLMS